MNTFIIEKIYFVNYNHIYFFPSRAHGVEQLFYIFETPKHYNYEH